ncbi:hypothetical protein [Chryseobacterium sp.]|uniref:hypothetical protein n=1 Tax=Chryseobacterium sp. TaxID=1871047 RepID=UPI0024E25DB9|nr:hypothetical protein [Chryseobacterium sp.]
MKKKHLLTYDITQDHQRVIQDLISNNWHSVIQGYSDGKKVICYFPETTWWKEFETTRQAYDEFKNIAGSSIIKRQIVVPFDDFTCSTSNPMQHQIEEAKRLNLKND